ncbi:MAG: sigma-70 family RNA polymerase sigma factor [Pseudomonadota bacterium]
MKQPVEYDDPPADSDLIARIADGDRDALKLIYDRHAAAMTEFVKKWLADPFEAADVTHETMLEINRSAKNFAGRSSAKTWMYSIARFRAIDRTRKSKKTITQDIDVETADDAPDPLAVTEAFQDGAQVRACIEKLSANHQSVIHLAFYDDMTYAQIASVENVPVGTIKTRMMHAKKLLMRCLTAHR